MAVIGYITDTETIDKDVLSRTMDTMQELHCDVIHQESTSDSTERPKLKYIMENVHDGDCIVLHKFSNALANITELTNLFRLCVKANVRLVSVQDGIDSHGIYYKTTHKELLKLMSSFCLEAYLSKHRLKRLKDVPETAKKIMAMRRQSEREVRIVDMYMSEYTYQEIMDEFQIKSRRTITNILSKYNIPLSRQKYNRGGIPPSKQ